MPSVSFYFFSLDSEATQSVLSLPTSTTETPIYDFAVDLNVIKTDLNFCNYTLLNENWSTENPDAQDISITFPDYADSAFIDLNNYGDYVVDRLSGQNAGISTILNDYSTSDENGIAILNNVRQHFGHPKVLSIFSGENQVKSDLKLAVNNAFKAKVESNARDLIGSFSFDPNHQNATVKNVANSLLRIISADPTRISAFQESTSLGFADLIRTDDVIMAVVNILESPLQLNLDSSTPTEQKSTKILIRLTVTDPPSAGSSGISL